MLAIRREREKKARKSLNRLSTSNNLSLAGYRLSGSFSGSEPVGSAMSGNEGKHVWSTTAWLEQLNVAEVIAKSLLWPLVPE
eukprot:1369341-Prymnesium_polylepis.2